MQIKNNKIKLNKINMHYKRGYIALITILIVSGVALATAATVSLLGIGVGQSALAGSKGENALQLVEGCTEDALLKSAQNSAYSGGNITRPEGTCVITISKSGNNWTIIATSTQTDYNYTTQAQFVRSSGSPITVTSWQSSLPVPTPTPTPFPANWYNSNWLYRQVITIDHTKVSGNSTNFPVLIKLPSNADLAAHAQANGNDILFTDSSGQTQIPHEIETYTSATGAIVAWVNVPSVTSTADTTIYIYYGNPSAANQQNKAGVWTNGYKSVLHMTETSGNVSDSSSNGNTGVNSSTSSSVGEIWNARTYSGATTSNLQIANNANVDFGANTNFMASLWFKSTQSPSANIYPTLLAKEINGHDQGYAILESGLPTATNNLYGEIWVSGTQYFVGSNHNYNDGNWHYVVLERNGSTLYLFVDGAQVGTTTAVASSITTTANVEMGSFPTGTGNFTGSEDEVRISNIAHSASWIATEYNNQSSPATFYSVAPDGPTPTPTSTPTPTPTPGPVTQDSVGTVQQVTPVTSFSWNHTVGNFSNRLIVVGVSVNSSQTVSSVKYGSQTLTRFDSIRYGSNVLDNELWWGVNPTVGTAAVTVTLSGSAYAVADSASFYNVNTSAPFGTEAKASGNGSSATISVPSVSNEVIIDILGSDTINGNFQPKSGDGQTLLWNGASDVPQGGASTKTSAGATTPMTWTDSQTDNWALIGVPIL